MVRSVGQRPRVAVVGTGLIGGSILLRLREVYPDVVGWDPDPATRAVGRDRGVRFPDALADAVRDRDVVFLAGPLASLPETLLTVARHTGDDCVVTDVGSTKDAVARFAVEQGLTGRFVPGHPMAGTERSGLTAAVPELFDGAAWVLCPRLDGIGPFRMLAGLLVTVFSARVVPMSPTVHDSVVALSSHVPHLLAGSLAGAAADVEIRDAVLGLAAGSFRDGTRVVGTPVERIADMLFQNRDEVLGQLGQVRVVLDALVDALRRDDADALVERYRRAQELRHALLDRALDEQRREFPVDGDHADELAYLLELGSAGGQLTGCAADADVVTYLARRPPA
ncbi:prephenate dehydrogenase/arogenate dehydrogenase family protein [Micromonospora musae]|uniref:Prephenate dehydrogenase/arogenate dehydrogenase family protein n=1 Tax=Micromonospora musae TaxID=1894970 RepID=A0ABX9R7L8_9ACTN|nr:prephenate dehydrogenase/arogenate dehydrogenase family protein [Micromonospora musae]RKN18215.1 prephenate dehydrogenase/arogenate dehydrogenase family protein [Micromonospora musae]